jgi:hypothetical protein
VRDAARIIKTSPSEVKDAFFTNKISIKQADKISKIKTLKMRNKIILAHKNIKTIDKSIERNFKKLEPKNTKNLIRTTELIDNFRYNSFESQKAVQKTLKSLLACVPMISIMDDKQLARLKHFQSLLEMTLTNALNLSENIQEKINRIN